MRARSPLAAASILASSLVTAFPAAAQHSFPEPAPIQAGVAPAPGRYDPGLDVLHYDIEVGLSDTASWIAGRTTIRVSLTDTASVLPLDFTGMAVDDVRLDGLEARATYTDGVLAVRLDGHGKGDTVNVAVTYHGTPDDGLVLGKNVHGAPSAFADDWPNRARFWFPSVDHPSDKATVRFTVHAPAYWRVVANGRLVSGPTPTPPDARGPPGDRSTWIWEEDVPIPTYTMVVGASDLVVRSVGEAACGHAPASPLPDGCVNVSYWVFPQDTASAARSFARAAEIVDYYTSTVGPFSYEKLANVQSATRFGGMENSSAIFYSQRAIASGRNIEPTVAHEIAHQWFGDAVTEADWHHLWLSEGFATYFSALFFEHADGEQAFRRIMEQNRQTYLSSDVTDEPIVDSAQENLFALLNADNYQKGAWVLHMLRGVLGDSVFFAGIRGYYAAHRNGTALTSDLQSAMEKASGRDLGWFFHEWIFEPGHPVFDVAWRWIPADGGAGGTAEVTVRQIQRAEWPRFHMPMELALDVGGKEVRRRVTVDGAKNVFRIRTDARPDHVVLDPDHRVLWTKAGDGNNP